MDDEEADSLTYSISDYVRIWNPRRDFFSKQHEIPHFEAGGLSFNDFPIARVKTRGNQEGYVFASSDGIRDIVYPDQKLNGTFQLVSAELEIPGISDLLELRLNGHHVKLRRKGGYRIAHFNKLGNPNISEIWVSDEPKYTYDSPTKGNSDI